MAVLKKGTYQESNLEKINLNILQLELEQEENVETLNFNQEEYKQILQDGHKEGYSKGYEEGYSLGYTKGYSEGKEVFDKEKDVLYQGLENDKQNSVDFLHKQCSEYITMFNADMLSLVQESMSRIFFNAIDDDNIVSVYLNNLTKYVLDKFKKATITANERTLSLIDSSIIQDSDIILINDSSLKDFDVIVTNQFENIEYFLNDEFEKIKEVFNS